MASKEIEGFGQSLGSLGGAVSTFAKVGLAAVATAGVGLVAGLGASINQAMNFEAAMSAVAAVAGGTDADLKTLSDTALKLGQDTTLSGIGATDAARAMRELAAAGMTVENIVGGGALGALRLASAGGIDVARAAEIAAMALSGFGLAGTEAARVADLFAGAANSSAISVDDIAETMKYVAPIAKSMGLSIEEVTATIAALGNQGIKGSQAGTSLRSMIVSLAKPSKEATKVMTDLGLSFFDGSGHMKDLAGVSEELKTKMGGLSDKQRASALATLFGNEALTAATVLYGEGAAGINKWLGEIENGATAAEVGAKRNDNLKGSIEALKSSFETAQIVLGKAFLPALRGIVDQMALGVSAAIPLIEAWGPKLVAGIQSAIGAVASFGSSIGSAVGAVVGAFSSLLSGQTTFAQFIGGMQTFVSTILSSLGGLAAQAAPHIAAFFNSFMSFLQGALPQLAAQMVVWAGMLTGWIATAIPALIGKLGEWGSAFVGWLTGTWIPLLVSFYGPMAQAFGGWITGTAIPFLTTTLPLWLSALGTWVTGTALPAIVGFVGPIAEAFGGWISSTAIPYLTTNLPLWRDAIVTFITADVIPTVTGWVVGVGNAMGGWIAGTAIPYLTTNLPLWRDAIVTFITADVIPTVVGAVVGIGNAMATWITTVAIPYLQTNLPLWKDALVTFITADVVPTVTGAVVGVANAMSDWIETQLIPRVNEKMPGFTAALVAQIQSSQEQTNAPAEDAGRQIGERLGEGLVSGGVAGITKAVSEWQTTLKVLMLTSLAGALVEAGAVLGPKAAEWIVSGSIPAAVANFAQFEIAVVQAILRMVAPVQLVMFQVGVGVALGLYNGIVEKAGDVWDWLSALPSRIAGAVGDMGGVLRQAGYDLIAGFVTGIQQGAGLVQEALSQITNNLPNWKGPPERDAVLLYESGQLIMQGLIAGIDDKTLDLQKKLADVTSSIAKAATDILGAIGAVAGFDFAANSPSGETLGWFRHLAESIIQTLADVATMLGTAALDNAKKVAESTGQIGSAVKSTLEGFKALAEYDFTKGSPTGDAMGWFRHLMESIVLNFAQAAQLVGTDGMAQATAFAKVVADVVGSMKSSLELFAKLTEVKDIPTKILAALFDALEGALEFSGQMVGRADEILQNSIDYLNKMSQAAINFARGGALAQGAPLTAPAGVGGSGGFTSGGGSFDKGSSTNVTITGNIYGMADFQDAVVDAVQTADRRGRS